MYIIYVDCDGDGMLMQVAGLVYSGVTSSCSIFV
jgi:hypothetical protein